MWDNPAFVLTLRTRLLRRKYIFGWLFAFGLIIFSCGAVLVDPVSVQMPVALLILATLAVYLFMFCAGAAGEAALLFVKDRINRVEDDLRLTQLAPAGLISGRALALFTSYLLLPLLLLPFYFALTAVPAFSSSFTVFFGHAVTPAGLAVMVMPLYVVLLAFAIATGCVCGISLRSQVGAQIATTAAFLFIGGFMPALILYLLESTFGKTPSTLAPGLVAIFFMLCHVLAAVILFLAAHQQLLRQDDQRDDG